LLLSYAWLVGYKSDFRIAQEKGIIPADINWEAWSTFLCGFLDRIDSDTMQRVDKRYQDGELRLSRLNTDIKTLAGTPLGLALRTIDSCFP
jgi:hypothetical protein